MSAPSLASLKTDIEKMAENSLKHLGQTVDLRDRLKALEASAKVDLDALKKEVVNTVMDAVEPLLAEFRKEFVGDVEAVASDNVGLVSKAVSDLTTPAVTNVIKEVEDKAVSAVTSALTAAPALVPQI